MINHPVDKACLVYNPSGMPFLYNYIGMPIQIILLINCL